APGRVVAAVGVGGAAVRQEWALGCPVRAPPLHGVAPWGVELVVAGVDDRHGLVEDAGLTGLEDDGDGGRPRAGDPLDLGRVGFQERDVEQLPLDAVTGLDGVERWWFRPVV